MEQEFEGYFPTALPGAQAGARGRRKHDGRRKPERVLWVGYFLHSAIDGSDKAAIRDHAVYGFHVRI
jgi:hypothetical protein